MASVSNEQFFFSCIENSNSGKVNWANVAEECGIVSKGAASIKYTRLKEKFGTASSGANTPSGDNKGGTGDNGAKTPKKKKTPAKKAAAEMTTPKKSAKKRKLGEVDDEESKPVKAEEGVLNATSDAYNKFFNMRFEEPPGSELPEWEPILGWRFWNMVKEGQDEWR